MQRPAQGESGRIPRDKGRVLHAFGPQAVIGWIHNGQGLVGIGAVPEAVEGKPLLRGADVALARCRVFGLDQETDRDGRERDLGFPHSELPRRERAPAARDVVGRVEAELVDLESGIGRPGEVVDVLGEVAVGREVSLLRFGDALPRRAHDEGGRHRQCHVVAPEVGVKLGVGVEGVAVPASRC